MRKALNENPLVQVGLIGVLALVVGFLFITRMGSSSGATESPAADTSSSASVAPATTGEAPAPSTTEPAPAPDPAVAAGATSEFVSGPGLPAKVVDSYDAGETVVLLIVHRRGLDDRKLEAQMDSAASVGDTSITIVNADDIADYSRIAEGVDVDRVPALVVIEPKSRAEGPLPEASISYGYRGPESIAQAVRDAVYKGPDDLPYHPE